jgi:hypothetical protein
MMAFHQIVTFITLIPFGAYISIFIYQSWICWIEITDAIELAYGENCNDTRAKHRSIELQSICYEGEIAGDRWMIPCAFHKQWMFVLDFFYSFYPESMKNTLYQQIGFFIIIPLLLLFMSLNVWIISQAWVSDRRNQLDGNNQVMGNLNWGQAVAKLIEERNQPKLIELPSS